MKSREEITKMARELCDRQDTECAIFINGFVAGYREAEKHYGDYDSEEDGQDRKLDN